MGRFNPSALLRRRSGCLPGHTLDFPCQARSATARVFILQPSGFTLVEVALALGIAAFALVAIFGLLPVGLRSNKACVEQTAAAGIARAMVADMRLTPVNATSAQYGIDMSKTNSQQVLLRDDGSHETNASGSSSTRYLGYVTLASAPASGRSAPVRLLITWPAAADLNNNPPKNFSGFFEAVTAIDRN